MCGKEFFSVIQFKRIRNTAYKDHSSYMRFSVDCSSFIHGIQSKLGVEIFENPCGINFVIHSDVFRQFYAFFRTI